MGKKQIDPKSPEGSRFIFYFALAGLFPIIASLIGWYNAETRFTAETVGVIVETRHNGRVTGSMDDSQIPSAVGAFATRRSSGSDCDASVGYIVDGVTYRRHHSSCGTFIDVGDKVIVHYDPSEPARTGMGFSFGLTLLGSVWFFGFMLLSLFLSYKYEHGGWREPAGRLIFGKISRLRA